MQFLHLCNGYSNNIFFLLVSGSSSQSVSLRLASSASPRSVLAMQIPRLHPDPLLNKSPQHLAAKNIKHL